MSKHLFGLITTPYGIAANNRGDNEGSNITPLQKLLWNGEVHTTVSAEAIRWAMRYYWQRKGIAVNRFWDDDKGNHEWKDSKWLGWNPDVVNGTIYIDDDALGFMEALAASQENDAAYAIPQQHRGLRDALEKAVEEGEQKEIEKAQKKLTDFDKNLNKLKEKWQTAKTLIRGDSDEAEGQAKELEREIQKIRKSMGLKGVTLNRRGRLEVTRAISLTPFAGDITFNAKSGTKSNTSLYGTEVHATRYQYGFGLTPEHLHTRTHALEVVDAVAGLSEVAGNQSRFLFDFSPEAVVFRWTDDFAPRMLYGFDMDDQGQLGLSAILGRLEMGDLDPKEIVVGVGRPDLLSDAARAALARYEIKPVGVRQAAVEMRSRMEKDLGIKG